MTKKSNNSSNNDLKIIIFNSPPRTGKDEAVDHILNQSNTSDSFYSVHKRQFKDCLFNLTSALYGITVEEFLENYNDAHEESKTGWNKDLNQFKIESKYKTLSLSQRTSLIHTSENIIKPIFGKQAFGSALVQSLPENGLVLISDGGFPEEIEPLIDHVSAENILIVQIERDGCTYDGDSRNYLNMSNIKTEKIINNGTLDEFHSNVDSIIKDWLN